ncbi:hypothetical protein Bbelb_165990 [Branchiostoma belcheri]|nr:hypothetical protein Bbelb_165990 [Branchiostoma belcheri]
MSHDREISKPEVRLQYHNKPPGGQNSLKTYPRNAIASMQNSALASLSSRLIELGVFECLRRKEPVVRFIHGEWRYFEEMPWYEGLQALFRNAQETNDLEFRAPRPILTPQTPVAAPCPLHPAISNSSHGCMRKKNKVKTNFGSTNEALVMQMTGRADRDGNLARGIRSWVLRAAGCTCCRCSWTMGTIEPREAAGKMMGWRENPLPNDRINSRRCGGRDGKIVTVQAEAMQSNPKAAKSPAPWQIFSSIVSLVETKGDAEGGTEQ